MKKDDPNWKHKKGSTSESVEIESLVNSGVFSEEEIAKIVEAVLLNTVRSKASCS